MSIPRLALALALLATAMRAEVEFSGYLRSGDSPRFVLTDKSTGQSSDFLSLGGSFAGVTLSEFNAAEEMLTLKRDAEVVRLRLKDSRVREGQPSPAPKRLDIYITPNGVFKFDGNLIGNNDLDAMLKALGQAGERIAIFLHEPPNPNSSSHAAVKRLAESIRFSGLKKWSMQIVDGE